MWLPDSRSAIWRGGFAPTSRRFRCSTRRRSRTARRRSGRCFSSASSPEPMSMRPTLRRRNCLRRLPAPCSPSPEDSAGRPSWPTRVSPCTTGGGLDPAGPITVENLANLGGIHGSPDERWFVHRDRGDRGARRRDPGALGPGRRRGRGGGDTKAVTLELRRLGDTIRDIAALTERTRECCDPRVFYHRVRPPFSGWPAPRGDLRRNRPWTRRSFWRGQRRPEPRSSSVSTPRCPSSTPKRRGPPHLEMRRYMMPEHRRFRHRRRGERSDPPVGRFRSEPYAPRRLRPRGRRALRAAPGSSGHRARLHRPPGRPRNRGARAPAAPISGASSAARSAGTERSRLTMKGDPTRRGGSEAARRP